MIGATASVVRLAGSEKTVRQFVRCLSPTVQPPTLVNTPPLPHRASGSDNHAQWFSEEIKPHEQVLRSYLRGSFPTVRDVDDVVQESYLRVWRAAAGQKIESAKAFLFTVARRLALDSVRRQRISPIEELRRVDDLSVVDDRHTPVEHSDRVEESQLLAEAVSQLPKRCREVFLLYKVQGVSRREAATALGLSEKTVEAHTAKAMRHCEAYLARKTGKGGARQ